MADELILTDTSVLIDFYRKKDKRNAFFYKLTDSYTRFAVSVITEYEVLIGTKVESSGFWKLFFEKIIILPFDSTVNQLAVKIFRQLKADNKLIEIPDILIAATAMANNLSLATLNMKHFERAKGLNIIPHNPK